MMIYINQVFWADSYLIVKNEEILTNFENKFYSSCLDDVDCVLVVCCTSATARHI